MSIDLENLLKTLDLEQLDDYVFRGYQTRTNASRTFGGQLLGHTVIAAGRTVSHDIPIHSISAHFVKGGDKNLPIEYHVDILRSSKRYANRQVSAFQNDELLYAALVAFSDNVPEKVEHSDSIPDVRSPEEAKSLDELLIGYEDKVSFFVTEPKPIEWRYTNEPAWVQRENGNYLDYNRVWVRAAGPLPDDPLIHAAVFAFSSDTTILDSLLIRHGFTWGYDRLLSITVNHTLWFHEPINYSNWYLYSSRSSIARGGRGLVTAHLFDRNTSEIAVTAVQECIVRSFRNNIATQRAQAH